MQVNIDLGEAGKEAVRKVGSGFGKLLGPAAEELSLLLGDQMRFWRFKNALCIMDKAEQILSERQISPEIAKTLDFGEQFLILEKASLEAADEVQSLWAALIANSVDPSMDINPEKRIIDILSSVGPQEAGFLKVLSHAVDIEKRRFQPDRIGGFQEIIIKTAESHWRHFPREDQEAALQNLIRLRCIALRPKIENVQGVLRQLPRESQFSPFDKWSVISAEKFEKLLNEIASLVAQNSGLMPPNLPRKDNGSFGFGQTNTPLVMEFAFGLTALGKQVLIACEKNDPRAKHPGEI